VSVCGALVHALQTAKELHRRGNEITLLTRPSSWIIEPAQRAGVPVRTSEMRRHTWRDFREACQFCKAHGIEVLLAHMSRANNFAVWLSRLTGIPAVLFAHSHRAHFHWRMAAHVIAVSEQTRLFHIRCNRVPPQRISTVHGFIDPERLGVPDKGTRQAVRAALGLAPANFVVGVVGHIIPRKGQIYLIRALPEVVRHAPQVRVLLVGREHPPKYGVQMRHEIERLGVGAHVLWMGERTDVPRLMQAMDLYCLPTLSEMLPLAMLEAMWVGLPIIATHVGGIPEAITDGVEGWLIPAKDPAALAQALLEALTNPDECLTRGANAHARVERDFTVQTQVAKIEAILQTVAR